jgi:hypothetical protein
MSEPSGMVQATTKAGQQRNDTMSLFSSASNLVKTVVNQKREKEDRDLTADLALITAASSNPEDPHNKAIMEGIASDPKRVKRLQKAIGYNPFSGEAPGPETKTMMQFSKDQQQKKQIAQMVQQKIAGQLGPGAAQQGVQTQGGGQPQGGTGQPTGQPGQGGGQPQGGQPRQGGSAMDQLMSRMPNTMQLSPMVELHGALIKAGMLTSADTTAKSFNDLIKLAVTNDQKYAEMQSKLMLSDRQAANRLAEIRERGKYLLDVKKLGEEGAGKRTERRALATERSATTRAKATTDAAKIREQAVSQRADITKKHDMLKAETKHIDEDIKNLETRIQNSKGEDKERLIREQEMKKELKTAKENLMDAYDKQGAQIDDKLKQSPTSLLNEGDSKDDDDLSKSMDDEDKIF